MSKIEQRKGGQATSRRVTTPLKWHGGKHYLASRIVALMPKHICYVEPYAGGLSVLLAKDPEGVSEVVNDLNRDLTNFWVVLQSPSFFPGLQRMVEATPFSEAEFNYAEMFLEEEIEDHVLLSAWAFFVRCRLSLAGRMESFTGVTRTRTRRGMNNEVSAWLTTVEGLPAVHERLKRVLILDGRPAVDVIQWQDGPDTLFYCDPPYLHGTRASTDAYAHEMTEADHQKLLAVLSQVRGKFLLSGYRSDLYDAWANQNGYRRFDFDLPNHAAGGKEKRRMTECVWLNYDPSKED